MSSVMCRWMSEKISYTRVRHMEVQSTRNTHVTRDHLCGRRIVEAELVEFGLDTGKRLSISFSKLTLRLPLGFNELERRLQVV
jgi:hypothetical protein